MTSHIVPFDTIGIEIIEDADTNFVSISVIGLGLWFRFLTVKKINNNDSAELPYSFEYNVALYSYNVDKNWHYTRGHISYIKSLYSIEGLCHKNHIYNVLYNIFGHFVRTCPSDRF